MNSDRESGGGRVPLPGFSEPGPADATRPDRADGIRHVRRMSNWTAAALIVGTGAATVALAHQALPAAIPAVSTAAAAGTGAATTTGAAPAVGHSVATTSASGVTTTTTTRTVHGKTIVTHTRHVPAYHDS